MTRSYDFYLSRLITLSQRYGDGKINVGVIISRWILENEGEQEYNRLVREVREIINSERTQSLTSVDEPRFPLISDQELTLLAQKNKKQKTIKYRGAFIEFRTNTATISYACRKRTALALSGTFNVSLAREVFAQLCCLKDKKGYPPHLCIRIGKKYDSCSLSIDPLGKITTFVNWYDLPYD